MSSFRVKWNSRNCQIVTEDLTFKNEQRPPMELREINFGGYNLRCQCKPCTILKPDQNGKLVPVHVVNNHQELREYIAQQRKEMV